MEKKDTQNNFKKDELDKLAQINKSNKKVYRISSLVGIIAITIGLSAMIYSIFQSSKKETVATENLKQNTIMVDSLSVKIKHLNQIKMKKDSIKFIVSEFLESFNDSVGKNQYLADTLVKYYLKSNQTIEEIKKSQERHKQRFPRSKVIFDKNDFLFNFDKKDTTEVFLDAIYYRDSLKQSENIIYQIKLNKGNKIFFIRNLEPQ